MWVGSVVGSGGQGWGQDVKLTVTPVTPQVPPEVTTPPQAPATPPPANPGAPELGPSHAPFPRLLLLPPPGPAHNEVTTPSPGPAHKSSDHAPKPSGHAPSGTPKLQDLAGKLEFPDSCPSPSGQGGFQNLPGAALGGNSSILGKNPSIFGENSSILGTNSSNSGGNPSNSGENSVILVGNSPISCENCPILGGNCPVSGGVPPALGLPHLCQVCGRGQPGPAPKNPKLGEEEDKRMEGSDPPEMAAEPENPEGRIQVSPKIPQISPKIKIKPQNN